MPFASNSSSACAEVAHRKTNAQSSMSGRLMTTMLRRCLLSTASKPSNGHPTKASSSSTTTTTITSTTDVDGGVSTPHRHGPDCWSCGARDDKSMFFCQHCDAIQAPRANTTAFDVFDCAESFDVDVQQLSQRFKQLQVKLHPDKWATRTPVRWLTPLLRRRGLPPDILFCLSAGRIGDCATHLGVCQHFVSNNQIACQTCRIFGTRALFLLLFLTAALL
jgi:hypothetical protein